MKLEIIVSFLGTCIGFGISLLTLVLKLAKNKKVRKTAEQSIEIMQYLYSFIIDAEQFSNYSGEEKRMFVLTRMNQILTEKQIPYEEECISQKLEELIRFSKFVNNSSIEKGWI